MNEAPDEEVKSLRFLRVLVTVLTAVMIVGFIVLIGFLVTRFPTADQSVSLPDQIALPGGKSPLAFTQGPGWYAVVTSDNQILIYGADDNLLRQTIEITITP